MSVTITKQQAIGSSTWALAWTSTLSNPTFYIYQDGILSSTTQATSGIFNITAGAQLLVEILDDPNQVPTAVYSGVVQIGWYQTPATASYKIEQWSGTAWTAIASIADVGNWWNAWTSPLLPDCQPYQFRVTPIGTNGNPGTPQTFNGFMVRIPDAPAGTFTLNTDSTVTIT